MCLQIETRDTITRDVMVITSPVPNVAITSDPTLTFNSVVINLKEIILGHIEPLGLTLSIKTTLEGITN